MGPNEITLEIKQKLNTPLIKQFELTALGLNEPLHKLARLVWKKCRRRAGTEESWISFRV